jgi:hypothetical protein
LLSVDLPSFDHTLNRVLLKTFKRHCTSSVRDIAAQIASDNNLTLKYTPSTNPMIERLDQHDHSDAYALQRAIDGSDFVPKVVNGQLWIRSMHEVEMAPAVGTIVCPSTGNVGGVNGSGVLDWEFTEMTEDCNYAECALTYKDPVTGNTVAATVPDPNQKGNSPRFVTHKDPLTGQSRSTEGITSEGD